MLKVKPFKQSKAGYCGPASLKMVLDFYRIKKTEKELIKICGATPRYGMGANGFRRAAKKFSFKILIKDFADFSDIKFYLKKKIPVIVDWFSVDNGHYSVAVGIDSKKTFI